MALNWSTISTRLDSIDRAMWERANALAIEAHVGIGRNVWHNAMLAYECGRPWSTTDYSLLRDAIRIDARRSEVYALRSRLFRAYERQIGRAS